MYTCDTCNFECRNHDEMEAHEANHLGLTVEELHKYNALKSFASYMGSVVSTTKNEATEAKFDKAIKDLIDFEKEHNILNT